MNKNPPAFNPTIPTHISDKCPLLHKWSERDAKSLTGFYQYTHTTTTKHVRDRSIKKKKITKFSVFPLK